MNVSLNKYLLFFLLLPAVISAAPSAGAMTKDELQFDMIPAKSRDGFPMRLGPKVMPGPADTYNMYGINWANVSNTPFRIE
jgi:hypothetical protein